MAKTKTLKIQIPTSWEELTNWQLGKIGLAFMTHAPGTVLDIKVLYVLLNIRWYSLTKKIKARKLLKAIALSELKKHYQWVYNESSRQTFTPYFRSDFTKYNSPKPRLSNLTIAEFATAEDLLLGFLRTKETEYLTYLTAVLFSTETRGKRTLFDKDVLDRKAEKFKHLSYSDLAGIFMSYIGARRNMMEKFPNVFASKKNTNKTPSLPKSSYLGKVITKFSGDKFGTFKETQKTNVYIFLQFYEDLIVETSKTTNNGKSKI